MNMQTCQRCGGARWFGTGSIGWGGPTCSCLFPQILSPDVPPQSPGLFQPIIQLNQILERLERIENKIDSIVKK